VEPAESGAATEAPTTDRPSGAIDAADRCIDLTDHSGQWNDVEHTLAPSQEVDDLFTRWHETDPPEMTRFAVVRSSRPFAEELDGPFAWRR